MTDADFLRAICDEPENMAPRLMYADWLIERGHPRGEFIREQIENPMPENPRSDDSLLREDWCNFFDNNWKWSDPPAILAEVKTFTGPDTALFLDNGSKENKIVYRRGFVERVHHTHKWWADHGKEMVKIAPVLKVYSTDREPWNWSLAQNAEKPWGWVTSPTWPHRERFYISPVVFDLMKGELTPRLGIRCYATKEDAIEDLSYGLLKWARS